LKNLCTFVPTLPRSSQINNSSLTLLCISPHRQQFSEDRNHLETSSDQKRLSCLNKLILISHILIHVHGQKSWGGGKISEFFLLQHKKTTYPPPPVDMYAYSEFNDSRFHIKFHTVKTHLVVAVSNIR
jgi:hypothetical protein